MNLLLINPRQQFKKNNIWKNVMGLIPPLGLAQLAAVLEKESIPVRILDTNVEFLEGEALGQKIKELIKSHGLPSTVGITATTNTIHNAFEIAALCKKNIPGCKIVMGGIHPTILPEEVLRHESVDYVVRGEGEYALLEFMQGKEIEKIEGLSYLKAGQFVHNPPRKNLTDMDDLPFPAYHLLPMEKYRPSLGSYKKLPAIGMITTRGCPGQCTFCYGQFMGDKLRVMSAGRILEEIKFLQKNYGIREISFYDDTFTAVRKNLRAFCEALIKENIGIVWSCFSRVDFVNEEVLSFMKRAGCHQICYGVESGDETILRNIKKHISLEKARLAIKLTKQAGIEARATFMLGNPGETEDTMKKTIEFAIELDPDIALFNITTPYPGTEMYQWARDKKYLEGDGGWLKYDLSTPVMNLPTVSPELIKEYYIKSHKLFYRRPAYIFRRIRNMRFADLKVYAMAAKAVFFQASGE